MSDQVGAVAVRAGPREGWEVIGCAEVRPRVCVLFPTLTFTTFGLEETRARFLFFLLSFLSQFFIHSLLPHPSPFSSLSHLSSRNVKVQRAWPEHDRCAQGVLFSLIFSKHAFMHRTHATEARVFLGAVHFATLPVVNLC